MTSPRLFMKFMVSWERGAAPLYKPCVQRSKPSFEWTLEININSINNNIKVVSATIRSKFWVDLQDVPLVNIINTNIFYACDIGQGHLHQHYLHFQRHICPVLFSRGWVALGEGGASFLHQPLPSLLCLQQSTPYPQPPFTFFRRSFSASLYCIGDGGASPARILS